MTIESKENSRKRRRTSTGYPAALLFIYSLVVPVLGAAEYHVAIHHPNASDSNIGLSSDRPFKTLSRAVEELRPGDTLSIRAGIYREALVLTRSGTENSRILIRAYPGDEGMAVIRGSDVVEGWTNDEGDIWSVPWQPLPLINYPPNFPNLGEYSRSREMVFVDGSPLKQVLSHAELVSGHFWMDDAAERMRINIPGNPNNKQVEISVRDQGVMATGSYHVFRGIRVEHVTNEGTAAMHLGPNQRVEDCRVEYNNLTGIKAYSGLVFVRSTSNHNGMLGIALNGDNSYLESSETSHNSWRFGPGWQAGGIKIVGNNLPTGNRIVRHTAKHNNGRGVWFDTVGSGNVVEASVFEGNVFIAIEFEAALGPNWIINNVILDTALMNDGGAFDGSGIAVYEASETQIFNNTIAENSGAGIIIGGGVRGPCYSVNTQVFNNIVVNSGSFAVDIGGRGVVREEPIVGSHHFNNNVYYGNPVTIRFPKLGTLYSSELWSLAQWQANRGEDLDSLEADPGFVRPAVVDYSLSPGSPAIDAGCELADVSEDILGWARPQNSNYDIGAYECPAAGGCGSIFLDGFESGNLVAW